MFVCVGIATVRHQPGAAAAARTLVVRTHSSTPIRKFLDAYTEMIADLALLLATLSIMTGALVITGVPTKLGSLLVEAAGRQSGRHGA